MTVLTKRSAHELIVHPEVTFWSRGKFPEINRALSLVKS